MNEVRTSIQRPGGGAEIFLWDVTDIKRVRSALDIADDTFVIFTSDYGELLGDHGLIRKGPAPYRQLLQVPLVMAGPGITPGLRDGLTSHVDIRATIREYAGLECGEDDGQSFAGSLAEPAQPLRQRVFDEFHPRTYAEQYNLSLITDHWRLGSPFLPSVIGAIFRSLG